jgi:hypothetical protein
MLDPGIPIMTVRQDDRAPSDARVWSSASARTVRSRSTSIGLQIDDPPTPELLGDQ